jgi:hypothetical protein
MRAICVLVLGLLAHSSSGAQTTSADYPLGKLDEGVAVGAIVGIVVVAVAGVGITYYILHKGVAEGCVAEADGKKTLMDSNKRVYSLLDGGPWLPVGGHVKLKGHKSGPKSAPSIQVEKVLKVFGPCKP